MSAELHELRKYEDLQLVRKDAGFAALCDLFTDLAHRSPAAAEMHASRLCQAHFITPAEQNIIFERISDVRRELEDRERSKNAPRSITGLGWLDYWYGGLR